MSKRYQGGILGAGFNPLQAPNAPTIGTATAGDTTASVAFTAPANVGGSAITSYVVQSTPGGIGVSGASSPITVSGLTNGTAYTFRVTALNSYGPSPASASSNSVTPNIPQGQQAYTAAGTYTWVKPSGVTNVSIVAVGAGGSGTSNYLTGEVGVCWCGFGGGGGGGGGLAYLNNYDVSARSSLQIIVGTGGSSSTTVNTCAGALIFSAGRGQNAGCNCGGAGGSVFTGTFTAGYSGGRGGNGGYTACGTNYCGGGGGGGGGYAGVGGTGRCSRFGIASTAGSGGGGGGGGASNGGGGVGILGQGADGAANGGGGSGGASATGLTGGGAYGGGGAGRFAGAGASGAVRVIWPGTTRSFPSTNTGDL